MSSLKLSRFQPTGLAHLDYHVWGIMLEKHHELQTTEMKAALQTVWEELPQEHAHKAVANFIKCLTAYMAVAASDGHFQHVQ